MTVVSLKPAHDDEPYAVAEQKGRWSWRVYVLHGISRWGLDGYGWTVWGSRSRAEKQARRRLAEYVREQEREAARIRIEIR